jgi:histone H3/H4
MTDDAFFFPPFPMIFPLVPGFTAAALVTVGAGGAGEGGAEEGMLEMDGWRMNEWPPTAYEAVNHFSSIHLLIMARTKRDEAPKDTELKDKLAAKKKTQTKTKAKVEKDPRPRKHRPGVVALRNVKKQALRVGTFIQKAPFERFVREIGKNRLGYLGFQKDAIRHIQLWVETLTTETLSQAGALATHRRQPMLRAADVALAEELAGNHELADLIRAELCQQEAVQLECEKRSEERKQKKKQEEEEKVAAA